MTVRPISDESDRLKALDALELLDTAPEAEFDELALLAAAICGTPICLVSLVDERRQWFKAAVGIDFKETTRESSICTYAIQQTGLFVVEDAMKDPLFAGNPLVTGETHLRFYAGMPLTTPEGFAVGTLCVIDREPRKLSEQQRNALKVLARQVSATMELGLKRRALAAATAEKDAAAARLRASEELFRVFMNNSPVASCIQDAQGRFIFYNTRYVEAFGVESQNAVAPGVEADTTHRKIRTDAMGEKTEEVIGSDSLLRHWRFFRFPCRDAAGQALVGCVAIEMTGEIERGKELARYQGELEAANDRLRSLSVTDELTGLRNRRGFEERLAFEFAMARRKKRSLAVVLLDVDDFKKVNDRLGHPAGDSVLQQLGKVLQATVRTTDLAVRYGGEEFAVILPETDERGASLWSQRLEKALGAATWQHCPVTLSMGVACLTPACLDGAHMMTQADQALYGAKRRGKHCVVRYSEVGEEVPASEPTRLVTQPAARFRTG
jgi:diguanylate cyclase (GGDEF)-like protein